MNRLGNALFAAVEAIIGVGVGIGIVLVPLTLLWGVEYGLQIPFSVFWHAAASVWLIGHGVDVSFLLSAATAKASGLSGASAPIVISVAALGFAVVTAWMAYFSGRRLAGTEHRGTSLLSAIVVTAVLSAGLGISAESTGSHPVLWQAIVLPTLWFSIPLVIGAERERRRLSLPPDPITQRALNLVDAIPQTWRHVIAASLRAGTMTVAVVVAVAGVVVGFRLLGSYSEIITLYERSHAGFVGGLAITIGEIASLPDVIGWAVSWIIGPGFALGTGSTVSPIATTLGPLPSIPLLGALPASGHTFGLVWVLVPVIAGFVSAAVLRPRLVAALGTANAALPRAVAGLGAGVTAGVLTGWVSVLSSGSFGPGRLSTIGPNALSVGLVTAIEVGVPAMVALAIGSDLVRFPAARTWQRGRWIDDGGQDEDAAGTTVPGAPSGEPSAHDNGRASAPMPGGGDGLLGALDRATAGRTTDVHRFVVEGPQTADSTEPSVTGGAATAGSATAGSAPAVSDSPTVKRPDDLQPEPEAEPELDADADADAAERAIRMRAAHDMQGVAGASNDAAVQTAGQPGGRLAGLRRALRRAADGVRDGVGDVRENAAAKRRNADSTPAPTPAPDSSPAPMPRPAPTSAGTSTDAHVDAGATGGAGGGFPWRTDQFKPSRDDDADGPDNARSSGTATGAAGNGGAAEGSVSRPGETAADAAHGTQPNTSEWDVTDEIPESELPWWRRPKDGQSNN